MGTNATSTGANSLSSLSSAISLAVYAPVFTQVYDNVSPTAEAYLIASAQGSNAGNLLGSYAVNFVATITAPADVQTISLPYATITSTYTPTSTSHTTAKGLTSGAAAGLGIGCVIAGALIAGIILLLLNLRSKKRHGDNQHSYEAVNSRRSKHLYDDKAGATVTISIPETSSAAVIQRHLPPPAEERGIMNDFSTISDRVDGHVQGYYRRPGLPKDASVVDAISRLLGYDVGSELHSRLPSLLADSNSRVPLLRAALAAIIIPRIDSESGVNDSFLPPEVAGMVRSMGRLGAMDTGICSILDQGKGQG